MTMIGIMVCLTACGNKVFVLSASDPVQQGLTQQLIKIEHASTQQWLMCYTEIKQDAVIGISCQSDAALPLFSGGLVDNQMVFEGWSRFTLKTSPLLILSYVQMSLFNALEYDRNQISLHKRDGETEIMDLVNHNKITIRHP